MYKDILKPYAVITAQEKNKVSEEDMIEYLNAMIEAAEECDIDTVDEIMKKLEECYLPDFCMTHMDKLRAYVVDFAIDEIVEVVEEMKRRMEKF